MAPERIDRQLLVGILASQMGCITGEQLTAAASVWLTQKSRRIEEILTEQGALIATDRKLLVPLVQRHIDNHDGDPGKSLAALSSIGSVVEGLRSLGDDQVDATLSVVSSDESTHPLMKTTPIDSSDQSVAATAETQAARDRFRILRPHARGGLGEVSVAQDEELNREVALKELQQQFADRQDCQARFLLEAEVTGSLEHPGIVPVYGLGRYADGRPFYAMRFIKGDSLEEAVDRLHDKNEQREEHHLAFDSVEFRRVLGQFVDVCNAIAYAHSRGVLHRDLKPGNIMLGKYGETLVVDWGLAKVQGRIESPAMEGEARLDHLSGSGSAPTQMGSAIGTPAFMPPEQAAGKVDELGPASDVYSLGATLYYVLTGQSPISSGKLNDVLKRVQAGDFASPRTINADIPQPLESICLRAMSTCPQDRYASPQALADDVERFLADEPVSAHEDPFVIRARRWMRKHPKSLAALATTVLVGLSSAIVIAGVVSAKNHKLAIAKADLDDAFGELSEKNTALERANEAERKATRTAEAKRVEADKARKLEQIAKEDAEARRRESKAVLDFFQNNVLAAARPESQRGGLGINATIREAIDAAKPKVADVFDDQPLVEASIRSTLGSTYHLLGESQEAIEQLESARQLRTSHLGSDHAETLLSMNDLAVAYQAAGRLDEAQTVYEETVRIKKEAIGPGDVETLKSMNNMALAYQESNRLDKAIPIYEEVLEIAKNQLGMKHPFVLTPMNNLATAYLNDGRLDEALPLLDETLEAMKMQLGPKHPHTLTAMNNIAHTYQKIGRLDEALPLFEEALALMKQQLGLDHPQTLTAFNNVAVAHLNLGQADKALPILEETLRLVKKKQGPNHPDTLSSMTNLAGAYLVSGRQTEAITIYEELVKLTREIPGSNHLNSIIAMQNLARVYSMMDQPEKAQTMFEQCIDAMRNQVGAEDAQLGNLLAQSAVNLIQIQQYDAAESQLRECLSIRKQTMADHWLLFNTKSLLGEALSKHGESLLTTNKADAEEHFSNAESLLLEGYQGMEQRKDTIPPAAKARLTQALQRLVDLYTAWDKPDKRAKWQTRMDETTH